MKIVFFSSPDYAIPLLNKIQDLGHDLSIVITQRSGQVRRHKVVNTAIYEYCKKYSINCVASDNLNDEICNAIQLLKCDLGIIYAYGKILPTKLINIPKHGIINLHCSLLPAYRGAAPIQHALIDGRDETGITYFEINDKLDAGKILLQSKYEISDSDDCESIQASLTSLAVDHLDSAIKLILKKQYSNSTYTGSISYANKITKSDSKINTSMNVRQLFNKIRALHQWPCVSIELFGEKIQLIKADVIEEEHSYPLGIVVKFNKNEMLLSAKGGFLSIKYLRFPGKKTVSNQDLYNSNTKLRNVLVQSSSEF